MYIPDGVLVFDSADYTPDGVLSFTETINQDIIYASINSMLSLSDVLSSITALYTLNTSPQLVTSKRYRCRRRAS